MIDSRNILLIIPTSNEEKGIPNLLEKAKQLNLNTIVLDGGSTDGTVELVKKTGTKLVKAPKGKGKAFQFLMKNSTRLMTNEKHLLIIDGDGTYDLNEFYELTKFRNYDMVIGKRMPLNGSFSFFRLWGNKLLNLIFSILYLRKIPDLLSGYRLIDIEKLRSIEIKYNNFELETELTSRFLKKGYSVKWVLISYDKRKGNSKLRPIRDGFKILRCILYLRLK